jgi:hypothetical protein|tara:strand:+ start:8524 stop:8775 length:252 start_codon:yes stop_codon:yes gene_type:complete
MKISRSRLKQIIKEEMGAMAAEAIIPKLPDSAELAQLAEKAATIHGYLQAMSEEQQPDPICPGVAEAVTTAYDSMVRNECEVG